MRKRKAQARVQAARPYEAKDFSVIWAAPILWGKSEAWRRFIQEMMGDRRQDYEDACRRLGIRAARAWITETTKGDVGVIAVIAVRPEQIMARLAASDLPFDRWFRSQLVALQGLDITTPPLMPPSEMVLDWQEATAKKGGEAQGEEVERRK